jgi:transcriptional regulator with XRE-family HTH domain
MTNSKELFNISVGKKIKERRLELGLTREKLSELTQISDKFIYDIEVGKKGMNAYTLFKIAKALGVTMDWLVN